MPAPEDDGSGDDRKAEFLGAPPATGPVPVGGLELPPSDDRVAGSAGPNTTGDPGDLIPDMPAREAERRAYFSGVGANYRQVLPDLEACYAGRRPTPHVVTVTMAVTETEGRSAGTATTVRNFEAADANPAEQACLRNAFEALTFEPGLKAFSGEEPRYTVQTVSGFEYFVTYRVQVN